jgi:ribosomal-protein-alanine N-acetyltransferase
VIDIHTRWMIRRDYPDVLEIERQAFADPWDEQDFTKALRNRNCIGVVAMLGEEIVGFMVYELRKTGFGILNLAVAIPHRMNGVGRVLVNTLKGKMAPDRRSRLSVLVRESNLDAQLFFRAMGLRCVNIERKPFGNSDDDGYLFAYRARAAAKCSET